MIQKNCVKCGALDYLSTVDGKRVCAKCAADAFWARMPDPMQRSLKEVPQ